MKLRRRDGDAVSVAVLDRVKELIQEINNTADEIREKAATIHDETPPQGNDRDT